MLFISFANNAILLTFKNFLTTVPILFSFLQGDHVINAIEGQLFYKSLFTPTKQVHL